MSQTRFGQFSEPACRTPVEDRDFDGRFRLPQCPVLWMDGSEREQVEADTVSELKLERLSRGNEEDIGGRFVCDN